MPPHFLWGDFEVFLLNFLVCHSPDFASLRNNDQNFRFRGIFPWLVVVWLVGISYILLSRWGSFCGITFLGVMTCSEKTIRIIQYRVSTNVLGQELITVSETAPISRGVIISPLSSRKADTVASEPCPSVPVTVAASHWLSNLGP